MTISLRRIVIAAIAVLSGLAAGLACAGAVFGDPGHVLVDIWVGQVLVVVLYSWALRVISS